MTTEIEYLAGFAVIGFATFLMRAIFFFYSPNFIRKPDVRHGLNSIPSSLLVVLVIPFALFEKKDFLPLRLEVLSIILAGILSVKTKKPGLSLIFALGFYSVINLILNFL